MILQVDEEGKTAVTQLCDIALKQGGVQVVGGIVNILAAVKQLPFEEQAEEPVEEPTDETVADNE